jgi:hypothetical protein
MIESATDIAVILGVFAVAEIGYFKAPDAEPLPVPKPPGPGGSCPHGGYTAARVR